MTSRTIQAICFLYLFFIFSWYPSHAHGQSLLAKEKANATKESIVGEWVADVGNKKLTLKITRVGGFLIKGIEIPGDRIVTFYRLREEQPVKTGWWQLLNKNQR